MRRSRDGAVDPFIRVRALEGRTRVSSRRTRMDSNVCHTGRYDDEVLGANRDWRELRLQREHDRRQHTHREPGKRSIRDERLRERSRVVRRVGRRYREELG